MVLVDRPCAMGVFIPIRREVNDLASGERPVLHFSRLDTPSASLYPVTLPQLLRPALWRLGFGTWS